MVTVEIKQERKKLSEGRNYGLGFSILEKLNSKKFQTYLPYTACKDYLNDFAYVESEKREIGEIHGYDHKLIDKFNKIHYFYLGVNVLHYNNRKTPWADFEKAQNLLINNYKTLEKILNDFESKIGIRTRSSIILLDDKSIIIKSPKYWLKKTWLISVFTLIVRCYFNVSDNNYDNLEDLIFKPHLPVIGSDKLYLINIKWFFENIKNIVYDKLPYTPLITSKPSAVVVHNFGIKGLRTKWKPQVFNIVKT